MLITAFALVCVLCVICLIATMIVLVIAIGDRELTLGLLAGVFGLLVISTLICETILVHEYTAPIEAPAKAKAEIVE